MKKALSIIGNCIFVIVIIYLCYFVVAAAYHRTPSFFGYRMLRVISDSMEPVFINGDCIIIKKVKEEELANDDIITFMSEDPLLDGAYNTHRIYDIVPDHTTGEILYFTKGDNNNWEDEYVVKGESIVGKYIGKLPLGNKLSVFLDKLSERNFYFIIVIVPIVLCLTSCIVQLVKEIRHR